jgi:hypothetical protein
VGDHHPQRRRLCLGPRPHARRPLPRAHRRPGEQVHRRRRHLGRPGKAHRLRGAPGTDPIDLANDKEAITADPTDPTGKTVYVVWDRLDHPSDSQDFNAFHGLAFREDILFSRTTDGGLTWDGGVTTDPPATYRDLTNFKANVSGFGNQIVVEPDGTLVDVFTQLSGSGNQPAQAGRNVLGAITSKDKGATWSDVITGPAVGAMDVSDPDTGAAVRSGEPILSVAADPTHNGYLYAVWADGRFSDFTHDDIALAMSTDGGLHWSDPIKVNQTPTTIPAGDQQAFTPNVAVNSDGTVAVTYYDFRNNVDPTLPGLATDYWIVVNSDPVHNPSGWSEARLTNTSFNMENAAPTSRGYFLGDYEGLVAAGRNFYALFAQAGTADDPTNIFFRDPPPAPAEGAAPAAASPLAPPADLPSPVTAPASGSAVRLDPRAADLGGLAGLTTCGDEAFAAPRGRGEQDRAVVPTASAPEPEQALVPDDDADGSVQEALTPGARRTSRALPSCEEAITDPIDAAFAQADDVPW